MRFLSDLARYLSAGVLLGFAGVTLWQVASGRIPLAGLLRTKSPSGAGAETLSPARFQLLLFTLVVAADYLHAVLTNPSRTSLPALPSGVVAALGGSQAVYLGGKAFAAWIRPYLKASK
jgi:hypothetical protein